MAVDTLFTFNGSRCESCCNCPQGSVSRENCVTNRPGKLCKDCLDQGHGGHNGVKKGKKKTDKKK